MLRFVSFGGQHHSLQLCPESLPGKFLGSCARLAGRFASTNAGGQCRGVETWVVCWRFGKTYVDQPISTTWIIEHALGVKLTSSLLLVRRRICRFKFHTFTAGAALDRMNWMNHLWVSNRFCIKLQNTLGANHKVEMLQNHKVPVLKDFKRTLQIKVSLIGARFLLPSSISCLDS